MDRQTPDVELVQRAVGGDERALERLLLSSYDALAGRVGRRIPAALRGVVGEEDILQQTFLCAFRDISTFEPRGRWAFYRWLCRIADDRLRDAIRAERAAKRGGGRAAGPGAPVTESFDQLIDLVAGPTHTASRSVARHEAADAVHLGLAALPEHYRRAIELRYLRGLPVAEVATLMQRTPHAVHNLCHRAVQQLQAELGHASRYLTRKGT